MDKRRRSRSPRSSHRHHSSSSERYSSHKSSRHERRHHHHSHRSKKQRSPSPRYRFDSPPKSFLAYNQQLWDDHKTSVNPEGFINKIQQVASTIPSSQANKIDRELYIGNLPSGITSTQLVDLLNSTIASMELNLWPGPPVISAWISNDGHYAFIEFRSIEEAKAGYALNNVSILGQPLRVGKPRTYAGNEPPVVAGLHALGASAVGLNKVTEDMASKILGGKGRLILSGLPHGYCREETKKMLEEFGTLKCMDMPKDPLTGLTKGYAIFDYEEDESVANVLQQGSFSIAGCKAVVSRVGKESLTQAFLPPTPELDNRAKFSSRILVLKNMVRITDLENDDEYQDLHEDVLEECKKYGRVISIVIPKPGEHTSGIGKIFVEYTTVEEAMQAKVGLTGMKFNDKRVECSFHPEELFFQGNFVG